MKSLQDKIVKYLADKGEWIEKGVILEQDWKYDDGIRKYMANTADRELRSAESGEDGESRIAVKDDPNSTSVVYKFIPPEFRKLYIPFSKRENKSILFRADLSQDIPNPVDEPKKRTLKQNDSLHLFCDKLSTELNSKGMYMQLILKPDYELRWDMKSVKENLYKPIAKALYGLKSTTELDTSQVSKVHEQLMLMLVEKFPQVDYVDFPSEENTESYLQSIKD